MDLRDDGPVITRYSLPEMDALFSDEARLRGWLEVEVLAVEGWAKTGVVPPDVAAEVRARAVVDVDAVAAREEITHHDVAAFVDVVQERIGGPASSWVHYGLTSTDVVDTAQAATLMHAATLLLGAADRLVATLRRRAEEFRHTPTVGRTHGIHAEPTTFGRKLALWALQVDRDRTRLVRARDAVAVGKLSGAVGTYSNIEPEVEAYVCDRLGLRPVPATQVLARDRHAEYLFACASVGATIESIATEIRHLQRTEVGEVSEPFRAGAQKGSSAMPHKRNPVKSEQLSGLARILRGNLHAGLENVALWHERDISHSSVERVVLADSSLLAHYLLVKVEAIIDGLVVHVDRMRENLDASFGLVFSQAVLLALVESGLTRDDAYRLAQAAATTAWEERRPFRDVLAESDGITAAIDTARLDECFDLDAALVGADHVFVDLDALPVASDGS